MVDIYYAFYGNKKPFCIPDPKLEGIFSLERHRADAESMLGSRSASVFKKEELSAPSSSNIKSLMDSQKDLASDVIIEEQVDMMTDVIMTDEKMIKVG